MKNSKWALVIGIIAILGFLFIDMDSGSARSNTNNFLTHVTKENFEKAFDYLYYHNHASDEEVTISYKAAKEIWVNRVKQLKEEGTYIKSFEKLVMRPDDGWQNGYVKLTVVENGKEVIYDNVYIAFNQVDGKWKVISLQEDAQHKGKDQLWEIAYSGYVGK
ncbi:hypothetical protein [Bacillus pinisoli]|uniref:hypothetical protein n=1 Tax=Bacillus pinisoli TaxID=2901866 RepID=UPI001FF20E07|nr:hypothetical protein [Bacillus pinisoli]